MTTGALTQPAESRPVGSLLANMFWGTSFRAKLTAGIVILLIWQVGVTLFAPAFVATPIGVAMAFPSVITSKVFLVASKGTLFAVFQGLAIALVFGTVVGVAMGRLKVLDRALNFYVSGFYTMPMIALSTAAITSSSL